MLVETFLLGVAMIAGIVMQAIWGITANSSLPRIAAGELWEQVLYHNLQRAQAVIAVLTPNWHASKSCFEEIAYARAQGKTIFPVKAPSCEDVALLGGRQASLRGCMIAEKLGDHSNQKGRVL